LALQAVQVAEFQLLMSPKLAELSIMCNEDGKSLNSVDEEVDEDDKADDEEDPCCCC